MISVDDVAMVISPSSVVPGSAKAVGDGMEFQIDSNTLTTTSIGIIVQMMGFEQIGFSNCMARIVAAHKMEEYGRFKIVVRPPSPQRPGSTVRYP